MTLSLVELGAIDKIAIFPILTKKISKLQKNYSRIKNEIHKALKENKHELNIYDTLHRKNNTTTLFN